jgi:uncharacterized protein YcbK (DUF882 family)
MLATTATILPAPLFAAIERHLTPERNLSFFNTHTAETLDVCYFSNGYYSPAALAKINAILRDHRTGEIKAIETGLLDILHAISSTLTTEEPFHIISGYRSPASNSQLRRKSKKVAAGSLHMQGKAIDIRIPGCRTAHLREVAMRLKAGGVGYYQKSDFVHVDTGRVRFW